MRLCKVSDLVGNEVVAKTVMTHDYQILLSEGTIIRKSFIRKLQEYCIDSIYIRGNDIQSIESAQFLKKETEDSLREKLQVILEQHIYKQNNDLREIGEVANIVISSIMANEMIVEQVYEIQSRSTDLYEHSLSVCITSIVVAIALEFDEKHVYDIGIAALLHDMGIRFLPLGLEHKRYTEMKPEELAEYRKHPVYAYSSLENASWLTDFSKRMILHHHESCCGDGYPLSITKLTLEQSLLSLCEDFDEMIIGISQKETERSKIIEYLRSVSDKRYPRKVVDVLLKYIAVFPIGTKVLLSDGNIGMVVKHNAGFPERPVVQLILDSGYVGSIMDLLKIRNITISRVVNN